MPKNAGQMTGRIKEAARLRTLMAGGDVFLCRDLPGRSVERGADWILSDIAPLLSASDIAMVNLESVIAEGGYFARKAERRPYYFHCPPALVNVLVEAGVTCVTLANNHAGDFGPEALVEQLDLLQSIGLASVGAGRNGAAAGQPVYLDAGGLIVAVLAFETESPSFAAGERSPGIFHLPIDDHAPRWLAPLIAEARRSADIVIVSPHWGPNWSDRPSEAVRRLARGLIELGADAVLGHSAHVLQGVEVHRRGPIVYDMGCVLVDRAGEQAMRRSALFELRFDRTGVRCLAVHPLQLSPGQTRRAAGQEAREICHRIVTLSADLNVGLDWHPEGDAVSIELDPGPRAPPLGRRPPELHRRDSVRLLPQPRVLAPSFLVPGELPPELNAATGVDMGGGFVVLGQRRSRRARTGYGFLVEVLFACPDPCGRHWRASLTGACIEGDGATFRYRHPVSEGMWLSQSWDSDAWLKDAFVVRPPIDIRAGGYRLRWTLVDVATGRIWPATDGPSPVGWVELGRLDITDDAPAGVAGIDWDTDLLWTSLTAMDQSR